MLLIEKLDRLQQSSGDVGVRRGIGAIDEILDAAGEGPLLLIHGAGAIVERGFRDDVALGEARRVDTRHGQRVLRLQPRQREQNDLLGLGHLPVVSPGGVDQEIDAGGTGTRRRTGNQQRGKARQNTEFHDYASRHCGGSSGSVAICTNSACSRSGCSRSAANLASTHSGTNSGKS